MSIIRNVLLNSYSSMKKRERFRWFLTQKIDFESQNLALFDTSPLHQFSNFNNFLWVCWFLGENLSNFVPPTWKFDNPYCHKWTYIHEIPFFSKSKQNLANVTKTTIKTFGSVQREGACHKRYRLRLEIILDIQIKLQFQPLIQYTMLIFFFWYF